MSSFKYLTTLFLIISIILLANACFQGFGKTLGNMPRDQEFLINTSPKFYCTLYETKPNQNCSDMFIRFRNEKLESTCINSTTLEFSIKNATEVNSGMYHCNLSPNTFICAATYNFGTKPKNVTNFKCISKGFQNLNCTWEPVTNKVKTTYTIAVNFGMPIVSNSHTARSCPTNTVNQKSCVWGLSTQPPYYRGMNTIYILLTGSNRFGNNTQYFSFKQSEIIEAGVPANFNYTEVAEDYVYLNWTYPQDMHPCFAPLMEYEITYKSKFDYNWTVFNEPPKNKEDCRSTNIEYKTRLDLIPNTVYDIGIRCRVIESENLWSQRVNLTVKTKEAVPYFEPTIIPQSFMVTNTKPRIITLYWLGIEEKYCNAEKCGYYIQAYPTNLEKRKKRDLQYEEFNIEGFSNTSFEYRDHRENTDYEFVIFTENEKGLSANSTSIKVPSVDKLPQKPKDLRATSSSTSYTIEWDAPDNDGSKVDSYTIFWCLNNQPRPYPCEGTINWLDKPVPYDQRSVQLPLPDNGFIYQFAVAANIGNLSSGLEWVPCVVPVDRVLDQIRHVGVTPEGAYKFRVSWRLDCLGQTSTVKNYTIRYRYCSNSCINTRYYCNKQSELRVFNQSLENQVILDGLKPYSYYLISVGATTINGINEFSLEQCQQTLPGAPSPPLNIRYKNVTSHSAVVEWDKPRELNGPLDKYLILVNRTKVYTVSATGMRSYTLKNLTSYVNHSITVEACNGNLCSNDSDSVEFLTNISRPGRLKMLPHNMNGSSTAIIRWDFPSNPNGPIDYYNLYLSPENDRNVSTSETLQIDGESLNIMLDLPCDPDDPYKPFMVSMQAVNVVDNEELYGPMSDPERVTCSFFNEGMSRLTIGLIVGLVVGFGILIVILYTLVNWMKGKVEKMRNITADLPEGLNSPQSKPLSSYENFKNGLINNPDLSPKPAYGRLDSFVSEDSFKNRHGSGTSQFSATSTDELIVKKTIVAEKTKRNPSGDSGGCCSTGGHDSLSSSLTHRTNLSSDSGNEADLKNPPSPETARDAETKDLSKPEEKQMDVSRVSGSKDSGVDKGDDSDEKSKSPVSPYSQFSSYVDSSNKALGSYSPQAPYSKFGMEQSCYVPYSRGRNMNLYGHNLANSEPSINEMEEGNHYSCLGAEQQLARNILDSAPASQYSKLGLSRSIQDVLGWRNYSSEDGGEGAEMKNSQRGAEGVVLPYSRFGIRRVESPTAKNNPYITVGMAFSMVDKDPNEILKQKRQEQVPWLPDVSVLSKNPLPSKPSLPMDEGKVPVIDVQPKDQAYSKFGMGEADYVANKNMDLAVKPFLAPITRPGEGYVNFDDLKITPISKMVADAENLSLNDAEVDDLDKGRDYGYDTMMASDSHSSDGIAPYSFLLPLSLKDSVEDNPELSLTLSDNIYVPPSYEDSKEIVSPAKMPSSSAGPIPAGNGYVSAEAMARCANLENDRTLQSNSTSNNHELLPTKKSPELKETVKLPDVNVKRSNGYVTLGELPSICGGGQEVVRYNMPITDV